MSVIRFKMECSLQKGKAELDTTINLSTNGNNYFNCKIRMESIHWHNI